MGFGERGMKVKLLKAVKSKHQAVMEEALVNIEVYENSVGIGEHPQHIDEADKLVDTIAQNEEKLGVIHRLKQ